MTNQIIKLTGLAAVCCTGLVCLAQLDPNNIDHAATRKAYDEMFRRSGPIALGVIVTKTNTPDVKWLGSPLTGEALGGGPGRGLLDQRQEADVQIGLREDGVVVWRKR